MKSQWGEGGRGPDHGQERAYVAALAEAGAMWWMEGAAPASAAEVRGLIARGPLRVG
jgi:hypothetical protein